MSDANDRHIAAAREWLDENIHFDSQSLSEGFSASLAALLQATEDAERERCEALAAFYVPGETQSSEADSAHSGRTAWQWGCSHAAVNIAAAIRKGEE